MLVREAKWFRDRLREDSPERLFPMLNVGSQTEDFRRIGQPWIDKYIFAPLRAAGHEVVHTDVKEAPGVDLVGDLLDPRFRDQLRRRRFRSILFSNVLEHVTQRETISQCLAEVVEPGGRLLWPKNMQISERECEGSIDDALQVMQKEFAEAIEIGL